jgi:poly-gamma-glutamate synthesis protein (capsule biosynthesis protein)
MTGMTGMTGRPLTVFLAGDVMTGRGVDQILGHPSDPALLETYVRDARTYVRLAEEASGPVPRPVPPEYVWGELLATIREADLRLINLETSVTVSGDFAPAKAVHYRMHPDNVGCLAVIRPVCTLANNHVLDFGPAGLAQTRDTLRAAGIAVAGAGPDTRSAEQPATIEMRRSGDAEPGRVLVFSVGSGTSGVPADWAAGDHRPGVALLPDLSLATADRVADQVRAAWRPGDVVVVSVHWGSNWGYDVPAEQVRFAHRLVDAGVDVVHGHSSHHPRPVEVYRGRLVLYGCGDLVDDYEGITGYERFRPELRLGHVATLRPGGGLLGLRMVPVRVRRMRLHRAVPEEVAWLARTMDRICRPFGVWVAVSDDELELRGA